MQPGEAVKKGEPIAELHLMELPACERLCGTIAHRIARMLARRAVEHDDREERALALTLSRSARRQSTTAHRRENADTEDDVSLGTSKLRARVDGFDLEDPEDQPAWRTPRVA